MTWDAGSVPDQTGRTVVVTGGNGGLGLETVRALAARGAALVMAARNPVKADEARRSLLADTPLARIEIVPLDLGSLASVRACARQLVDELPRIDLLFNNAGVMAPPAAATEEGFESQFGVNHLGHFALTALLMPALLPAPAGRVVTITSFGRLYRWRTGHDDLRPHLDYDPWRAYGRSKAANFLFGLELDRRLRVAGASLASLVAHPGFSHTDLQAESARASGGLSQRFFAAAVRRFGMSPEQAVLSQLRATTDPAAQGGDFYGPRWFTFGPPVRKPVLLRREHEAEELWQLSEAATGIEFDVARLVAEAGGPSAPFDPPR